MSTKLSQACEDTFGDTWEWKKILDASVFSNNGLRFPYSYKNKLNDNVRRVNGVALDPEYYELCDTDHLDYETTINKDAVTVDQLMARCILPTAEELNDCPIAARVQKATTSKKTSPSLKKAGKETVQTANVDFSFLNKHFDFDMSTDWEVIEGGDGKYKVVPASNICVVNPEHEHSGRDHSCVFINERTVTLNCFSCGKKKLPREQAKELINDFKTYVLKEQSAEPGIIMPPEWSFINELEGWEDFDYKAFFHPTHVSVARWFLWLKNSVIKKHTSGVVWVLGRNNIWQMAQDIQKTDLRLQICDAVMTSAEKLVSRMSSEVDKDTRIRLNHILIALRDLCENATWLRQVADMVYITCPEDDTCIDQFLSKPHLIAFTDCVYDLNTGTDRAIQPDDFVIHTTGYPFPRKRRPEVRADIDKFYSDIFPSPEIKKYPLLGIAKCLFGRLLEEVFHVLKGEGRNGKGTEDTLLRAVFGAYYYFISQKNLTKSATEADKPNSQLYNCFGRRYLASSETTPGDKFVSEIIKSISGNDPFPVRTLHGKPITFPFTGMLNISTNDDIKFDTVGISIAKRQRMVPYPFSFVEPETDLLDEEDTEMEVNDEEDEEDPGTNASFEKPLDVTLKTKFQSEEYRDECMLMLLDLYKEELRSNNLKIKPPAEVMLCSKRLLAQSMSCSKWFEKHYTITDNTDDRVDRTNLYGDYESTLSTFAQQNTAVSRNKFYQEMRSLLREITVRGKQYFVGLKRKRLV
ncbi:hypothetical protein HK104_011442 [Borealophlyctis nickersoniae]|nr:hypothetical protein HK104_011442 [Borealophlyctis nickersoniae]